jgi:hypothetical protein
MDDRVDGAGEGKPVGNWEEARERVEEGSTSGVSTINSNKSPKESTVVSCLNFAVIITFFFKTNIYI